MTIPPPLSPEACSRCLGGLPPSHLARLKDYVGLLEKWQRAINLVGPRTLADPWRRHILDSAQLADDVRAANLVADLGSGAGFPALVLAIVAGVPVHLIESDQRKATFLREVARVTRAPVTVHAARIEDVPPLRADVVTARALAPLPRLLPWAHRHVSAGGKTVLLKGANVEEELTAARKQWKMTTWSRPSLSDPAGTVITIAKLAPADVR